MIMHRAVRVLVVTFLAAGCSIVPTGSDSAPTTPAPTPTEEPTTTTTRPTTTTSAAPDPVEVALDAMTLNEKVGQMLMPVVAGTRVDEVSPSNVRLGRVETPAGLVKEFHLGGIIYLGNNIVDAAQVAAFSADLQAVEPGAPGLFISVDQEGGRVQRITDGVTRIPSARSLNGDVGLAREIATRSAVELRTQGINLVFAPVADLVDGDGGVINDRSYGSDPEQVAEMVRATIDGLQRGGVAATAKHWPGHGATTVDSHQSLPVLELTPEVWAARERVPFAAAVDAGVDMIMVGHLSIPSLDPLDRAATLSPVLTDDLLRRDLGFEGVIISDALDMGALQDQDRGEVGVLAVEAGIDILLGLPDLVAVRDALVEAVQTGRISQERLDDSVRRILTLKLRLGLL